MTLSLNFRMLYFTIFVVFRTDTLVSRRRGWIKYVCVCIYDDDGDEDYNNNFFY